MKWPCGICEEFHFFEGSSVRRGILLKRIELQVSIILVQVVNIPGKFLNEDCSCCPTSFAGLCFFSHLKWLKIAVVFS